MPRDLGKARLDDLNGHFAGEELDSVAPFARSLVKSGQMEEPEPGSLLTQGNGAFVPRASSRSADTEMPGRALPPGGNGAGELAPEDGNGQTLPKSDTVFEPAPPPPEPAPTIEPEDLQPAASLEPGAQGEAASGGGTTLVPTPEPATLDAEPLAPAALEAVPDLVSPELDEAGTFDDTEGASEHESRPSFPTIKPLPHEIPASQKNTGILELESVGASVPDESVLDGEAEIETGIAGEAASSEKITTKVEMKTDTDPKEPPAYGEIVRDTVNFYNQTQSLRDLKEASSESSSAMPTITPEAASQPQSLEIQPAIHDLLPAEPVAEFAELEASPDLGFDSGGAESLEAESGIEEADRRDTDSFRKEDLKPGALPLPEGTDRVDKAQLEVERDSERAESARDATPSELEAIAEEKIAAGRDTQQFYVSDVIEAPDERAALPALSSETVSEASLSAADTRPGGETRSGESDTAIEPRVPQAQPVPLPDAGTVADDFREETGATASTRLVPGLQAEQDADSDRTGDALPPPGQHKPSERITEKVLGALADATLADSPPAPSASERVRKITDALARRLREERDETRDLIEAAEKVAARLRSASSESRLELEALSTAVAAQDGPVDRPESVAEVAAQDSVGTGGIYAARESEQSPDQPDSAPSLALRAPKNADDSEQPPETTADAEGEQITAGAADDRELPAVVARIEKQLGGAGPRLQDLLGTADSVAEAAADDSGELPRAAASPEPGESGAQTTPREDPYAGLDLDALVDAAASLRREVESANAGADVMAFEGTEAKQSVEGLPWVGEAIPEDDQSGSTGPVGASPLAAELDRIWDEFSPTKSHLLRSEQVARIPSHDDEGKDWLQGPLWETLVGIAGATFLLSVLLIYIWFVMTVGGP